MAIEFNCPYCSASIRVPDAYSGKKGSCPKCSTKLIVPDVAPPTELGDSASLYLDPAADLDAGVALPSAVNESVDSIPTFVAAQTSRPSISRRLKRKTKKRKSQTLYTIGIPVVCLVLFFSVVGVLIQMQKPELKGALQGATVDGMQIPKVSVSLADFELTDEERQAVDAAFAGAPESFVSSQMSCRIAIDGASLSVEFVAEDGFRWYAVNPANNLALSDWIRDNSDQLNVRRTQKLRSTGATLCREKIRKAEGESVVFAADEFRDDFGINAHVRGFGSAVEAIGGEKRSFCFHEDNNGTLYFALPQSIQQFTLQGRTIDGRLLFPGEYTVKLDGTATAAPESAATGSPAINEPAEVKNPAPASETDSDMQGSDTETDDASSSMSMDGSPPGN